MADDYWERRQVEQRLEDARLETARREGEEDRRRTLVKLESSKESHCQMCGAENPAFGGLCFNCHQAGQDSQPDPTTRTPEYDPDRSEVVLTGAEKRTFCQLCGAENPAFGGLCFNCHQAGQDSQPDPTTRTPEYDPDRSEVVLTGAEKHTFCQLCGAENPAFGGLCFNCHQAGQDSQPDPTTRTPEYDPDRSEVVLTGAEKHTFCQLCGAENPAFGGLCFNCHQADQDSQPDPTTRTPEYDPDRSEVVLTGAEKRTFCQLCGAENPAFGGLCFNCHQADQDSQPDDAQRGRHNFKFMKQQRLMISMDSKHLLGFLLNRNTNWKSRKKYSVDPTVQAGHLVSKHSELPEFLALEDSTFNQWSSNRGETQGAIFVKSAIDIGGIPVERRTALQWESAKLLPKGTVAAAPEHAGWRPPKRRQ